MFFFFFFFIERRKQKKGSLFYLSTFFFKEKKLSLSPSFQASACASEALGGPLENTCAGAVACKAPTFSPSLSLPATPASVPVASASAAAGPLV